MAHTAERLHSNREYHPVVVAIRQIEVQSVRPQVQGHFDESAKNVWSAMNYCLHGDNVDRWHQDGRTDENWSMVESWCEIVNRSICSVERQYFIN